MNTKNQKGSSRGDFGGSQGSQRKGDANVEITPSDELISSLGDQESGRDYGDWQQEQGTSGQYQGDGIEATASDNQVSDVNEGEGSRTAARRYNKATEQYARSGKVQPAAREAKEALDSDESDDLRSAEQIGKQGGSYGRDGGYQGR